MPGSPSSKTLWQYFKAAFVAAHHRRPGSFYMLLLTPLALLLGVGLLRQTDNPRALALGLSLLILFFGAILLRAVMDLFEITRQKMREHGQNFRETLGDDDFINELGKRVSRERRSAENQDD